jgi:hypothetical protein
VAAVEGYFITEMNAVMTMIPPMTSSTASTLPTVASTPWSSAFLPFDWSVLAIGIFLIVVAGAFQMGAIQVGALNAGPPRSGTPGTDLPPSNGHL